MAFLKLGLLYVRAGLSRPAAKILKQMQIVYPQSICTSFFKALMAFQQRNFKAARAGFISAAELPQLGIERAGVIDGELKASLFAAAACSAYAQSDLSKVPSTSAIAPSNLKMPASPPGW